VLPLGVLRAAVAVICVAGIAGMIIGTVATDNNNGVVITFGLITAVSVLLLITATAVSKAAGARADGRVDDVLAEQVERHVAALVAAGAREDDVRALVRDAVRLGRSAR